MSERAAARRPMGYGARYPMLERGEVFDLAGLPNDEKLTRLGYCEILPSNYQTSDCGRCGKPFVGDSERAAHGRNSHLDRELTPIEEDQRADREERLVNEVAPLDLTKTTASKRSGIVGAPRIRVPE